MFQVAEQYLDIDSGMHVVKLRDGKKEHLLQIFIGHNACPACGVLHPQNLGEIDPKALVAAVNESLDSSHAAMLEYAKKHCLTVK